MARTWEKQSMRQQKFLAGGYEMKRQKKLALLFASLFIMILAVATLSIAQRAASGRTIERISADPQRPQQPTTTEREQDGTKIKETNGVFPTAGSIRDALRKGKKVGIGMVHYNATPVTPPGTTPRPWTVEWAHVVRVVAINDTVTYDNGKINWTHVLIYDAYSGETVDAVINETITPPTGNTPGKKVTFIFLWGVWAYLEDQVNLFVIPDSRQRENTATKPEEHREELDEVLH